jgi:hypothetical protein
MHRSGVVALTSLLLVIGVAAAAEVRTWKDSTGQFSIRAKLVSVEQGKARLEKEDGTEIEVEVKKLSAEDQAYLAEQAKAAADPFKPVAKDPFRPAPAAAAGAAKSRVPAARTSEGRLVMPNWSGASAILVTPAGGDWEVTVNPPAGPAATLAMRPIPIPPRTNFFEKAVGLALNPVNRRAVIGYNRRFPPNEPRSTRLVLCDLEKGKMLGAATETGVVLAPLALDDGGNRVLMCRDEDGPGNHDRLEIWTLGPSGIDRGLQWIAHDDRKNNERNIQWGQFLDANRVATMSEGGRLTIWELGSDTVRPVSFLDIQGASAPALSPDRKYLAFATAKELSVLDVETAQVVAQKSLAQTNFPVLTFSPSGKRLACAAIDRVSVFDFAKGTLEREVPYYGGVVVGGNAVMTSDDHVLLGKSVLIDLENQIKLWTYKGADLATVMGGVCWLVPATNQQQSGALVPAKLPQPSVQQMLQRAMADPNFFVLRSGTTVKVNVDGISDPGQRDQVRAALEAKLKAQGFQAGPEGTIELAASTELGKQREVTYRSFGFGVRGIKTYKIQEYISRLKFVYQGLTAWEGSTINIPHFVRLKQGESMEDRLREGEKPNYEYFAKVELPRLLTRPTAQGSNALGNSQVTVSGVL